jgi:hypothetical protein
MLKMQGIDPVTATCDRSTILATINYKTRCPHLIWTHPRNEFETSRTGGENHTARPMNHPFIAFGTLFWTPRQCETKKRTNVAYFNENWKHKNETGIKSALERMRTRAWMAASASTLATSLDTFSFRHRWHTYNPLTHTANTNTQQFPGEGLTGIADILLIGWSGRPAHHLSYCFVLCCRSIWKKQHYYIAKPLKIRIYIEPNV